LQDHLIDKVLFQKGMGHFPGIHPVFALAYRLSQAGHLLGMCVWGVEVARIAGKNEVEYSLLICHFGNLATLTRRP
jgi:hypothetical protein